MGPFSRMLGNRDSQRRAREYVKTLQREPASADVQRMAATELQHDADHARWELRYARLALGQLAAERQALDDRVPAAVAREIRSSLARDARVAAGMLAVAERQLATRLKAYRGALALRESLEPEERRIARELLSFVGSTESVESFGDAERIARDYVAEVTAALERAFGRAALPEDVRPSAIRAR